MFLLTVLALTVAAAPANSLDSQIAPLVKAHKGRVAIAVEDPSSGTRYFLHADEPMPTASLIKLAVMADAYLQDAEGKVQLSDPVTLRDADKVPGSGILTYHFSDGARFPLRDAIRLMIVFSDNTATNLVLDKVGVAHVNQRMAAWGLPNTRINAKVFRGSTTSVAPERTRKFGLGSTTAREMIELLKRIEHGKDFTPAARKAMLDHLKKCDDKDKFTRFLPDNVVVAHKTGSVDDARTDAGIIYIDGRPVFLCVLTADNADHRWKPDNAGNVICARVAKVVYEYCRSKRTKRGLSP